MNTKKYTEDQLHDAESVAKVLAKVPENKRGIVLMMVDAFVNGMTAQQNIDANNINTRAAGAQGGKNDGQGAEVVAQITPEFHVHNKGRAGRTRKIGTGSKQMHSH